MLEGDLNDPDLRRLFPAAYEDDAEAEDEYRRMTADDLLSGRLEALRTLEETALRKHVSKEELDAWLRALNDLRLVLGTRLGVTEEVYDRQLDPRDPRARELSLYAYLSWLQEEVVEAASSS